MTPAQVAKLIGELPMPHGSWRRAAVYASPVALRAARGGPARPIAEDIAVRLRGVPGIGGVRVRADGFLLITVTRPGEIVRELVQAGRPAVDRPGRVGPDFPRVWDNPGFVVRYAHARATAVQRWARELGVPESGFRPEALDDPCDRAVLRSLAELPGRTASRDPAWAVYAERLALAYHDAHEHAPAIPRGDEPVSAVHTARLWLATAVRSVLAAVVDAPLPDRL